MPASNPIMPATSSHARFLVTGGTGLVGNNVLRLLAAESDVEIPPIVRCLTRRRNPSPRPLPDRTKPLGSRAPQAVAPRPAETNPEYAGLSVEVAAGDITDPAALERACDGVRTVIHAAATVHVGWTGWEEMRRVNVEGTRVVAAAARRAGARLVHVSSVDAIGLRPDGEPADEETPPGGLLECPYVMTKREAERAVLDEVDRGLDAVIVNPVYMLGPWDWKPSSGRMLLEVAAGRGLLAPPGGNDFADVRDVAVGILAAAERGRTGRRYILGGHALRYLEAWRIFAAAAGRRPPWGEARRRWVALAGRGGDLLARLTGREGPVNSAATGMSLLPHHFSFARAATELGYSVRPLEQTARDAWQWFVEHGYVRPARSPRA
jgi:dihydroflavonol-4-reductase